MSDQLWPVCNEAEDDCDSKETQKEESKFHNLEPVSYVSGNEVLENGIIAGNSHCCKSFQKKCVLSLHVKICSLVNADKKKMHHPVFL